MGDLSYHRPKVLKEACELGRTFDQDGRFLAGGTELLVDFKRQRDSAKYLISLQDVPELKEIRADDGSLSIGAMVTITQIATSEVIKELFPVLAEAAAEVASRRTYTEDTAVGEHVEEGLLLDGVDMYGARLLVN